MPPKPKFTREEIIAAALKVVSQKGVEGLTARELGEELGSSARPIFTIFKNMDELLSEVKKEAMHLFENYTLEHMGDMPVFKQVGMRMVLFGVREPKLYQMLFMQENGKKITFDDLAADLGTLADVSVEAIQRDYELSQEEAKRLFKNVWIYTFGVGALCATRVCDFTTEQIGEMLSTAFHAMILLIKSENHTTGKKEELEENDNGDKKFNFSRK